MRNQLSQYADGLPSERSLECAVSRRSVVATPCRRNVLTGVSLLCLLLTTQAFAGQSGATRQRVSTVLQARTISLTTRKRTAPPPAQNEMPKTQIGDLTISHVIKMDALLGAGGYRWRGPNTEVEIPDKTSKSVLTVHADDIQVSRVGKNEFGLLTLNGSVRYRLVQKTDDGEHIIEGTAGHAEVRRVTRRMELTGGVRTKLTDAATLDGPATLRTGSLTIAMNANAYRYTLAGGASENDIQFTPIPKAKDPDEEAPGPLGTIHLTGFRSGDLEFGKAVHLEGGVTTCEFASPDQKTAWSLKGEQFEGEFIPNTSNLQRATVTTNVRFHVMQPSTDKKTKTVADGSSSQASYVRSKKGQELIAHGPLNIDFTDAQHFEEPMNLTAAQSATLSVRKEGESLSFSVDDPKGTQKYRIVPKPFDLSEPKPAPPKK